MKSMSGSFFFVLTMGFSVGMLASIIGGAWFGLNEQKTAIGFLAFGVPTAITGLATVSLWEENTPATKLFALWCVFAATISGACLLLSAFQWVFLESGSAPEGWYSFVFGIPLVFFAMAGIARLSG